MKRNATTMLVMLLFLSAVTSLWAGGKDDEKLYQPATGYENWDHEFDLSEYEEGTYNLIVKSTDRAGNIAYGGPYNVTIDPDSDLPKTQISNPVPRMRVGTNLNVVGTAIDDDALSRVEIKIDDGSWIRAEGKEFWSYYLNVLDLSEGTHVITARGVDVNGLEGSEASVTFRLDTSKPQITIDSHQSGMLLSGKAELQGTVTDRNGIIGMRYSSDDWESSEPLKLDMDKETGGYTFKVNVDTSDLEDGPNVYWFKATDETGSVGNSAFLFFVDNDGPVLDVLSPLEDEVANGIVRVIGQVSDAVGVKQLAHLSGGVETEIPLIPGNPYWTADLDFTGEKGGSVVVEFIVEDLTGNIERVKRKINLDNEADIPSLILTYPRDGAALNSETVTVAGGIRDDDGASAVEYSLDGGERLRIPSGKSFAVELSDVETGTHTIEIAPVDTNGVVGGVVKRTFSVVPTAPDIEIDSVKVGDENLRFAPGASIPVDGTAVVSGRMYGAEWVQALTVSINGSEPKKQTLKSGEGGERLFDISVGKDVPAGRVDIVLKAADEFGQIFPFSTAIFKGDPVGGKGLYLTGTEVAGNTITLSPGKSVLGFVLGGAIKSVSLEPSVDQVRLLNEENTVILSASAEGQSEPFILEAQLTDGTNVSAGPFKAYVDGSGPKINVDTPEAGSWHMGPISVSGTVTDPSGVQTMRYALIPDMGISEGSELEFKSASLTDSEDGSVFETTIPIGGIEDGTITIVLQAADNAGNITEIALPVSLDTGKPVVRLATPVGSDPVDGIISITGIIADGGNIATIQVSDDGENFTGVGSGYNLRYDADFSVYDSPPEEFLLKAIDLAGNETVINTKINIDLEADKPEAQIHLPEADTVIRSDFTISGLVFDDDGVSSIYYRIDDDDFRRIEGSNSYSIYVPLSDVTDNEHILEVKAEDLGGVMSDVASVRFMVSRDEPESSLISPVLESTIRESVVLKGESSDANGIDKVLVSFDNGTTFNRALGTESWEYRLDTAMLDDGLYSILVKAIDTTGTEGLYSTLLNIDNTPPVIKLDYPRDGEVVAEMLEINGNAKDNIELTSLSFDVGPISGEGQSYSQSLPVTGNFAQSLNFKELPPGWYNFRITATDNASNQTVLSRNISVRDKAVADTVDIMFPVVGAELAGAITVSGRVNSEANVTDVAVFSGEKNIGSAEVNEWGYYNAAFDRLSEGDHELTVKASLSDGGELVSEATRVFYEAFGPWIAIDNLATGDFVNQRPFIEGRAGISAEAETAEVAENEGDGKEKKSKKESSNVSVVEISTNNGKTFERASGTDQWRYRLETQEYPDGDLLIIARATFVDGSVAVKRLLVRVDETAPSVTLENPSEGSKFNDDILVTGTSFDDNGLEDVSVSLRPGDKSKYQVPAFIQGLYLDFHALGATYFDIGAGLTFFDDNVKLQAQIGMAPPGRFSGLVMGAKLLANLATVPFGYYFGPDWDFLSMSFAIGANFSYFTMSEDTIAFTEDGLVLGAVVGQWEYAKFTIDSMQMFNEFGLYAEGQMWFISSDVEGGLELRLVLGGRVDIF